MNERDSRAKHYLFAVLAVAAALALRYLLNPLLGQQGPYLILTLPIVLVALYGGFGPAMFATAIGTVVGTYLFLGSPSGQEVLAPPNLGRTVLFMIIGSCIAVIGGRLRASGDALSATVRELHASNRAKDNALATLAHEIRNPLSALRAAHGVLARGVASADATRAVTAIIGRQVDQMARLADDLLDVASILRGEVLLERRRVDLRDVIQQAIEQVEPLMQKKGHRLERRGESQAVEVIGDEHRLAQVFANLLSNAAKYTSKGGVISVELRTTGDENAVLSITDNGIGMDPKTISDMFEPFVRAQTVAENSESGLGIGLALVWKIVEMHRGTVTAESAGLGQGSRFDVHLPLAQRS